jgi:DNA-binding transcriptional MerR regulator
MTDPKLRAVLTLRRQRMPLPEIRAVLSADDPRIVRRHLELHRERLEEWVAEQRSVLASLQRSLTEALERESLAPQGSR